jgi:hypothetical protein
VPAPAELEIDGLEKRLCRNHSGKAFIDQPSATVSRTHFSSPYGRPRSMLTRTRSNSFLVKGALTRPVQFAGRSTGHGDNDEHIAAKCNRQTEAWGRIRELNRRHAGLSEDFDDDITVMVGEMVVTLAPERGYELPYSAQLSDVDRWALIRV